MPSRNTVKEYIPDAYYHVYNRGIEKRKIFLDVQDYTVFLGLLKKYLSEDVDNKHPNPNNRHAFTSLTQSVTLLAYCLMPNHFHLMFYQKDREGITQLMRRVNTGYVMYFNARYNREGRLFQGTYKAAHINAEAYLQHISRYIHLNPDKYLSWPYSSLRYYAGLKNADWLNTEHVLSMFDGDRREYMQFCADYVPMRDELAVIKHQLASGEDDS